MEIKPITVGAQFGRWTVLAKLGRKSKQRVWECRCECGTVREVIAQSLRRYNSCGCIRVEMLVARGPQTFVHGESGKIKTTEWVIWNDMVRRCSNPNDAAYKDYGGRGIKVCEEWLTAHGYVRFLAHVGRRPSSKHTIERVNTNGNYEPGNVTWATMPEQARNKRNNHWLTLNGETLIITDWATKLGVKPGTIYYRLRIGMPLEQALTLPGSCGKTFAERGVMLSPST